MMQAAMTMGMNHHLLTLAMDITVIAVIMTIIDTYFIINVRA
jgi:hypothetical protein